MSLKYSLPKGNGNGSTSLMRSLLIWGIPVLGWVALVIVFLYFLNGSEKDSEAIDAEPAPTEQTAPTAATAATPTTPATPPKVPATASAAPVFPSAPYDFSGAVSKLGLPKEAGCATGIIVDPMTRKVLWAKAADKAVPIASMTKMMTLLLAEEAIAAGKVTLATEIAVTPEASKIGGSQVWLDPRETFTLGELLKAVAIKSANDAAYLVGEFLGQGDADAFVARMNARAQAIGMVRTTFYDAHGLGDASKRNNSASAHDMVLLGERLIAFPNALRLSSTPMDSFRGGKTELKNHNNLVFQRVPGVDGLKTGYTKASGFCVTLSCRRNGRRLLACVTGFTSAKDRDTFCKALLNWGYAH
ncbi:MAG: D-alanyl-D-alanine carboxypeptidase family protein [Kiritimatiellia bacterium]